MSKKLRDFLFDEIERMYSEAESEELAYDDAFNTDRHLEITSETVTQSYRAVEVFEDVVWTALALPKPYRRIMLRRLAVLFEDSPNYKEKWKP